MLLSHKSAGMYMCVENQTREPGTVFEELAGWRCDKISRAVNKTAIAGYYCFKDPYSRAYARIFPGEGSRRVTRGLPSHIFSIYGLNPDF